MGIITVELPERIIGNFKSIIGTCQSHTQTTKKFSQKFPCSNLQASTGPNFFNNHKITISHQNQTKNLNHRNLVCIYMVRLWCNMSTHKHKQLAGSTRVPYVSHGALATSTSMCNTCECTLHDSREHCMSFAREHYVFLTQDS